MVSPSVGWLWLGIIGSVSGTAQGRGAIVCAVPGGPRELRRRGGDGGSVLLPDPRAAELDEVCSRSGGRGMCAAVAVRDERGLRRRGEWECDEDDARGWERGELCVV